MSTEARSPSSAMRLLGILLRVVVSSLLAYAGGQKLLGPVSFVEQVANYQWFPETAHWVAVLLPPVELTAAIALWLPGEAWRAAAALLAAGLFGVFTLAVARAYWLGINVDCGCFGEDSGEIGPLTVVRNLGLTGAALWLLWRSRAEALTAH